MNRTILKLAASAMIIGSIGAAAASDVTPKMIKAASKAADQAMAAIRDHEKDDAVRYAERAVLYNPASAEHRALLAQAYLQAGRFNSAETAFADALRLAPDHGRAALGLGLVQIALGKTDAAMIAIEQARGHVPDADVGLALALGGDHAGALALLEPAARAAGATPKTRQNLALVYALSGRWAEARATAALDVAPDQLDRRLIEWASFANPRGTNQQIATLLGVKPVVDGGMPQQLALLEEKPAAAPAAVAMAQPQVQEPARIAAVPPAAAAPTQPVPIQLAPGAPAPTVVETAAAQSVAAEPAPQSAIQPVDIAPAAPTPVPAPMVVMPAKSERPMLVSSAAADKVEARPMLVKPVVEQPAVRKAVMLAGETGKPTMIVPVRAAMMAPVHKSSVSGNFVVQLAAYLSEERLERGWNATVGKVAWLKDYSPVSTTYKVSADSRLYHRLSISGFTTRIEAVNLCRKIRETGGTCFVRVKAGDAPVQWVKRDKPVKEQIASR